MSNTKFSVAFGVASLCVSLFPVVASAHAIADTSGKYIYPTSNMEVVGDKGPKAHTNLIIHKNMLPDAGVVTPQMVPYGQDAQTLQGFFGFPSDGGSESIAIVDAYKFNGAEKSFNTYSKQAGLPQQFGDLHSTSNRTLTILYQSGSTPPPVDPTDGGWDLEQGLDIEVAHAIAPEAHIFLIEANSTSYADLFACVQLASQYAKEVSMSFSGSEFSGETSYDSTFTTPGVVYFGASGDSGGANGVGYPSCSPNVVGVGGVTLIYQREKGKFEPYAEDGWTGSGGGVSEYEPEPSYQTSYGLSLSGRGVPDISFDADPDTGFGEYVYNAGEYGTGYYYVGGTSLATPAIAAMVNDAGTFMSSSTDELDSIYTNSADFYDITQGDNGYYLCGTGWDPVTGIGTPLGESAL